MGTFFAGKWKKHEREREREYKRDRERKREMVDTLEQIVFKVLEDMVIFTRLKEHLARQ